MLYCLLYLSYIYCFCYAETGIVFYADKSAISAQMNERTLVAYQQCVHTNTSVRECMFQ